MKAFTNYRLTRIKLVSFPSFQIVTLSQFFLISSNALALTVTNTNDSGPGSLRDAIANTAPGGTVDFDPSLANQTISLTSGEILINKNLTIVGLGADLLTISGNNSSRIFNIQNADVIISDLKFADGLVSCDSMNCPANGGAILVDDMSTLEIIRCTFSDNKASCTGAPCFAFGGAIQVNGGSFLIEKTTFLGNMASCEDTGCSAFGGAIQHAGAGGSNEINNSTFCGNETFCNGQDCFSFAGAIQSSGIGALNNNNTFSDNTVSCTGGNCSTFGSSYGASGTGPTLMNTVVDNDETVTVDNCAANIIDGGNNLQFPDESCFPGLIPQNPLLGPLANNGGPTQTKAISAISPARDAGNNATCEPTDQRGVPRPQGPACDIGAYEFDEPQPIPTLNQLGMIITAGVLGLFGVIAIFAFRRRNEVKSHQN